VRDAKPPSRRAWTLRILLATLILASLVAGISGGLLRAGVGMPWTESRWLGAAAVDHAFLMICAFMGSVIAIERAVAVKRPWAFAGPVASASAGALALNGWEPPAAWLAVVAAAAFIVVNSTIVLRQKADHTILLLVAAVAWAVGCLLHALGGPAESVIAWWLAFLVLTVAAERLEMTRVMRRRRGAAPALHATVGLMILGAASSDLVPVPGGILYGLSLAGLATWLLTFDIAWRTVRAPGLSRYMALCLLMGYFWLLVAGAAWAATSVGLPFRDAALHGVALGFVFSMVLGHAPVVLPAIARVKVRYRWLFYVPLALLHGSLALRLLGAPLDASALMKGAAGNAIAIAVFAATVGGSAIAWRLQHRPSQTRQRHGNTADH